jgi:hypothetical protein
VTFFHETLITSKVCGIFLSFDPGGGFGTMLSIGLRVSSRFSGFQNLSLVRPQLLSFGKHTMIFKNTASVAAVAFALATMASAPALAGGGSAGTVPVRIKNVGSLPVGVSALSGSPSQQQLLNAARVVAPNGVSQFPVRPGAFTAAAADPNAPTVTNSIRSFNTRNFKTIYLQAAQDTTAATLVGAPGGVKF